MKRILIVLFGLMLCCGLQAQTHTFKYWFDNQYGQCVTTSFSGNVWDTELDVNHLAIGMHVLHYQLPDTAWSPTRSYLFHRASTIESTHLRYYYWFDNQYSNMQSGTLGDGILSFNVEGIPAGLHCLHLMLKGENYSSTKSYLFIKTEMADLGVNLHYHCWFDEDFDHQQTGMLGDGNLLLDVTALADGDHVVRFFLEGSTVAATQSYVFMKGTGVDENEGERFVLYPNPSEGTFVVEGWGRLSVVNPLGQQLFTRDMEGQTTLSLPSGFYLLRLENGNGSRMSKLLVK